MACHEAAHVADEQLLRLVRSRAIQKASRDRKKSRYLATTATVETLRDEVARLQGRMASLVRRVPLAYVLCVQPNFDGGPTLKIARQYVTLFKHGYNDTKRKQSAKQLAFLTGIAAANVRYNGGIGVQSILSNWLRYTTTFSGVVIEMQDCAVLKTDDGPIVKGVVKSNLKITQSSIRTIFPYCPDHLKPQLIGQVMTLYVTMHWSFDESDRLIAIDGAGDFVSGLRPILRSIEAVAAVLNMAAFYGPESAISVARST
ncbi:hypothetical protein SDRG_01337 [Saprolegnia diclina VS20]|uniref:BZIP domain-containing protein n=1 Tax=Saprolegnia diclina (strain VS20) TaxID=1156394 RepID=T0QT60_SAPDV|nr:hypothetical protein SDRG_01337 [Saprolegnia diclina VS20]EQC41364.1 hypothetical protein SDRG_01337 [Saprolegnia diclina VS20]|eukprot:XP_008605078.1 hypothetical protein SDRG_01337 [Saprolegnia diclina VS20]